MTTGIYAFNPNNTDPTCTILNEPQVIGPPGGISNQSFVVPQVAPFFKNGFSIWTGQNSTGTQLIFGVDYFLTHHFIEASIGCGQPVYGSFTLLNQSYTGSTVYVNYNTIGGTWVVPDASAIVAETLARYSINYVSWSQIAGLPIAFPPTAHFHDAPDLIGLSEVVAAINACTAAIINQPITPLITAQTIGLGSVSNYRTADDIDFSAATNNAFATAGGVSRFVTTALAAHLASGSISGPIPYLEISIAGGRIIVQFGSAVSGTTTVFYPVSFPTVALAFIGNTVGDDGVQRTISSNVANSTPAKTSVTVFKNGIVSNDAAFTWIAIGY
jgi:hypothetical protein